MGFCLVWDLFSMGFCLVWHTHTHTHTHAHTHIYIYVYIYILLWINHLNLEIRGAYDKFPDFFRMGI